jgi:hypothetical protein
MLPSCTLADGFAAWMLAAVRFDPDAALPVLIALIVFAVFADSATCPDAIACFTLPSFHRLFTITCWSATSNAGVPVISPFLKPSPIVNGAWLCDAGDVSVNDVTADPGGGGPGAWTVNRKLVACVNAPETPVTVAV